MCGGVTKVCEGGKLDSERRGGASVEKEVRSTRNSLKKHIIFRVKMRNIISNLDDI